MRYLIEIPSFSQSFLYITAVFEELGPSETLAIPAWRPGRYELSGYHRRLENLSVNDEMVPPSLIRENIFGPFPKRENQPVVVKYRFQANKMDAGNSWLSPEGAILNPVNFLMYPVGLPQQPSSLKLVFPEGYDYECQLDITDGEISAPDLQDLMDSPILIGRKLIRDSVFVDKVEIRSVFLGNIETVPEYYRADTEKYVREQMKVFGGSLPTNKYTFLFYCPDHSFYHGVEHKNSTMIVLGPASDVFTQRYEDLLGISSHEFFHLWNACRIRPEIFRPYPLESLIRFDTGWVLEGYTTYYGDLMLMRSGKYSREWFIEQVRIWLKRAAWNPASEQVSLVESSQRLWEYGYSPPSPQGAMSIYSDGALFAMMSHIALICLTDGKYDLDDFIRLLKKQTMDADKGYDISTIKKIMEELLGDHMESFPFDDLIYGTIGMYKWGADVLSNVGVVVSEEFSDNSFAQITGVKLVDEKVVWVWPGSPLEAKLQKDDLILQSNFEEKSLLFTFERDNSIGEIELYHDGPRYFPELTISLDQAMGDRKWAYLNRWLLSIEQFKRDF